MEEVGGEHPPGDEALPRSVSLPKNGEMSLTRSCSAHLIDKISGEASRRAVGSSRPGSLLGAGKLCARKVMVPMSTVVKRHTASVFVDDSVSAGVPVNRVFDALQKELNAEDIGEPCPGLNRRLDVP